jgi:ADP-ribosylglycohydrolase
MCEIDAAFPASVHLIAKYEGDLKEALVENVMAGGDSSSRGMVAGMVLGAHLGTAAIPTGWVSEMKQGGEIVRLLDEMG